MRKLLKYDLKSIWPIWRIMAPVALIITVLTCLGIKYIPNYESETETVADVLGYLAVSVFTALMVFVLAALVTVTTILILYRYYKNFFTDEGYLTFTLPVTRDQLLWSKIINAFIWEIATFLAVTVCGTAILLILGSDILQELISGIGEIAEYLFTNSGVYVIEAVLLLAFSALGSLLLGYLCITIGSVVAKKQKLLASIGLYLLGSYIVSGITQIIFITVLATLTPTSLHLSLILLILINAGLCAAYYFINRSLLTNKLNLP